jgi:hypothetical protein
VSRDQRTTLLAALVGAAMLGVVAGVLYGWVT